MFDHEQRRLVIGANRCTSIGSRRCRHASPIWRKISLIDAAVRLRTRRGDFNGLPVLRSVFRLGVGIGCRVPGEHRLRVEMSTGWGRR